MKKRRSPIGCLFWIALILLVVVIFVFNRARFETALKKTGLENLITRSAPKGPAAPGAPAVTGKGAPGSTSPGPTPGAQNPRGGGRGSAPLPPSGGSAATSGQAPPASGPAASGRSGGSAGRVAGGAGGASQSTAGEPTQEKRIRQSVLYYIRVSSAGAPVLQSITRDVRYNDSPLTDTLRSLLLALPDREAKAGLVTLIPSGTELLGVTVRNGTAFIDFNDRFRFNSLGAEGFRAELQQVVYTATQFPSVERVQILIGGQVHRFLGPEGMAIDKPLSRSTFGEG